MRSGRCSLDCVSIRVHDVAKGSGELRDFVGQMIFAKHYEAGLLNSSIEKDSPRAKQFTVTQYKRLAGLYEGFFEVLFWFGRCLRKGLCRERDQEDYESSSPEHAVSLLRGRARSFQEGESSARAMEWGFLPNGRRQNRIFRDYFRVASDTGTTGKARSHIFNSQRSS